MLPELRSLAQAAHNRLRIFDVKPDHFDPEEVDVPDLDARRFGWFQGDGRLLDGFTINREDTVLDVGCGNGGTSLFSGSQGAEVISVDIDPQMIETVTQRMQDNPARTFRGIVSDCDPLPLQEATASKIIAQEVMEHVDYPDRFLAELVRVGQPNAQYLITVPDPVAETVQQSIAPPCHWQKPNHIHVFDREELNRLIRDAGLTIERRASYSFYWSMWWILRWGTEGEIPFGGSGAPVLKYWNATWAALLSDPKGTRIKQALDEFMPKSQVVICRKAP